jgi:two-component system NtrC family sensor kinase
LRNFPQKPGRGSCVGRTLLEGKVIHIHDIHEDPEYTVTDVLKLGRIRTMLGVPLLREGAPIGVMALIRSTRMMGGDVTVASEPGKGSVFTVRLPGGT